MSAKWRRKKEKRRWGERKQILLCVRYWHDTEIHVYTLKCVFAGDLSNVLPLNFFPGRFRFRSLSIYVAIDHRDRAHRGLEWKGKCVYTIRTVVVCTELCSPRPLESACLPVYCLLALLRCSSGWMAAAVIENHQKRFIAETFAGGGTSPFSRPPQPSWSFLSNCISTKVDCYGGQSPWEKRTITIRKIFYSKNVPALIDKMSSQKKSPVLSVVLQTRHIST